MIRHILIDGSVFEHPATGVAKAALGLYQGVQQLRPDLRISLAHRGPLRNELPTGWTILTAPPGTDPRAWRNRTLPGLVREMQPDMVHFPWNGEVPRLPRGPRIVVTLHDVLPLEIPGYFRTSFGRWRYLFRKRRDLARAALVITDSHYSRQRIEQTLRPRRAPVVVYLATLLPPAKARTPEAPYYVYVGGYDRRKGLETLIEVFRGLRQSGRLNTRLVLTGTPHYFSPAFEAAVRELSGQGWLEERGYLDDQALADTLAGARALLYPSRYEGFGFPPLEAMSLGCPVVTTRQASLPEVCGDAALYIDPEDRAAFARAWLDLDRQPELRARLREAGLHQAARFAWTTSARLFLDALEGSS